jgi:hypothetical protein
VDAATTFTAVISALENFFHEPIDLYAAGVSSTDPPSILSDGGLYCGAADTKIHLFPGTTGLGEIGALRDCISAALSLTSEPSVKSLVNDAMSTTNLPLNSDGDNYLLEDLSSVEVEYTIIAAATSVTFPRFSFYTEGDVSGDGSYNWKDIKGTEIGTCHPLPPLSPLLLFFFNVDIFRDKFSITYLKNPPPYLYMPFVYIFVWFIYIHISRVGGRDRWRSCELRSW